MVLRLLDFANNLASKAVTRVSLWRASAMDSKALELAAALDW